MTPINNFDDILSAMEQDPALREALRNHVLGEEFMQLPAIARRQEELITLVINRQMELASTLQNLAEQISGYALASSRVITTTVERQDRIEADVAELKAGQAQLAASVQELLESQSRTETNIAELRAGQDRMDSRQDRMETNIAELRAGQDRMDSRQDRMDSRQDRMDSRQDRMDSRQDRMETNIAELKAGQDRMDSRQDRMEGDITELKAGQTRMEGQLNNLTGTDYERKVAKRAPRAARRYLGLRQASVVYGITVPDDNRIADLLHRATEAGTITDEQAEELERADLILSGVFSDDELSYAVAEVSVTIDEHDVDRARSRARILQDASRALAKAAVIGTAISEANRQRAEQDNVAVVIMDE